MGNTLTASDLGVGASQSKTAALAAAVAPVKPGSKLAKTFEFGREILRSPQVKQAGRGSEEVSRHREAFLPVSFLDGELHKKRRGQIARFFTPKAMKERYRSTMESSTRKLIARLQRSGSEQLDLLSFELACDVASMIVGITNSDPYKCAQRIRKSFNDTVPWRKKLRQQWFYFMDVRPAVKARRKRKQDDVLSLIIEEGYPREAILAECITYGSAGMLTTREFIVMVAWHLFEHEDLREKFLTGGEEVQFAILDELLRIDPVVTYLQRRAIEDFTGSNGETIKKGELYAIGLRSANLDETVVGPNPYEIDPDRGRKQRMTSSWMSFGDGPHRCPGAQVALHETRVFLDALLRVPGIRLAKPPTPGWNFNTYEMHGAIVECDRVG